MVLDEEQESIVAGLRSNEGFRIFMQWLIEEEFKELESMLRATKEDSMHKKAGKVSGLRIVRRFLENCIKNSTQKFSGN